MAPILDAGKMDNPSKLTAFLDANERKLLASADRIDVALRELKSVRAKYEMVVTTTGARLQ